jgi:hypothetical protein
MKNFFLILILVFQTVIYSQKIVEKKINSNSNYISIALNNIDHLELVNSNDNSISVLTNELYQEASYFTITDVNDTILIKSFQKTDKEKANNVCFEQPLLTSYTIKIPKNVSADVNIKNGNFSLNNFIGNLDLSIDTGEILINGFKGKVNIKNISGLIDCKINSGKINVISSFGKITSTILTKNLKITKNSIKGFVKNELNELNIKSIHSKISLNRIITE